MNIRNKLENIFVRYTLFDIENRLSDRIHWYILTFKVFQTEVKPIRLAAAGFILSLYGFKPKDLLIM